MMPPRSNVTIKQDTVYLTVEQVAARLRKHPETIRRWCRKGRLNVLKLGRDYLIPEGAIEC